MKQLYFKKIFFSFISLSLFFLISIFLFKIFSIKNEDIQKYHQTLHQQTSYKFLQREPIHQKRENVQKDIFILQNNSRLHFKIFSTNSTLFIVEKQNKIELKENLENIKCLMQDKIEFFPQKNSFEQKIRYFTAKTGTYLYPSNKFFTDSIKINFFELPGNTLPEDINSFTPYLKGSAKDVSFYLSDKSTKLNAEHFKASVDIKKALK